MRPVESVQHGSPTHLVGLPARDAWSFPQAFLSSDLPRVTRPLFWSRNCAIHAESVQFSNQLGGQGQVFFIKYELSKTTSYEGIDKAFVKWP